MLSCSFFSPSYLQEIPQFSSLPARNYIPTQEPLFTHYHARVVGNKTAFSKMFVIVRHRGCQADPFRLTAPPGACNRYVQPRNPTSLSRARAPVILYAAAGWRKKSIPARSPIATESARRMSSCNIETLDYRPVLSSCESSWASLIPPHKEEGEPSSSATAATHHAAHRTDGVAPPRDCY